MTAERTDREPINNCDGCQAGYPLDDNGHHYDPGEDGKHPFGRYLIGCTKDRYVAAAMAEGGEHG